VPTALDTRREAWYGGDMIDFCVEPSERILFKPKRFLIPVAQLPGQFLIPRSTVIVIMEYRPGQRERNRTRAWRLGYALCCAGVPVFELGEERMRIYCPCTGDAAVLDALQFHKESVLPDVQALRDYAKCGECSKIADIVGEVSYRLVDDTIIIDGARRQGTTFRTFTQQYLLPEGATLL